MGLAPVVVYVVRFVQHVPFEQAHELEELVPLRRAHERGELKTDALVRFPQLLAAPGIVAVVWSGLFDRFEPLDVRALMRAHFDVLLGPGGAV